MSWKPRKGDISRMEWATVLIADEKEKGIDLLIWQHRDNRTISVKWCRLRHVRIG